MLTVAGIGAEGNSCLGGGRGRPGEFDGKALAGWGCGAGKGEGAATMTGNGLRGGPIAGT